MLFSVQIEKTTEWFTAFGNKKTEVRRFPILYSASSEDMLLKYLNKYYKSEGTSHRYTLFRNISCKWVLEYKEWEHIDGEDDDANILILETPTGVIYEHLHRNI